jgi:hypothetical protein
MTFFDRLKQLDNIVGLPYMINHVMIALAIMLFVIITHTWFLGIVASSFAGAWGGLSFYWGREVAQAELRKERVEVWDALYPTIFNILAATAIFIYTFTR